MKYTFKNWVDDVHPGTLDEAIGQWASNVWNAIRGKPSTPSPSPAPPGPSPAPPAPTPAPAAKPPYQIAYETIGANFTNLATELEKVGKDAINNNQKIDPSMVNFVANIPQTIIDNYIPLLKTSIEKFKSRAAMQAKRIP